MRRSSLGDWCPDNPWFYPEDLLGFYPRNLRNPRFLLKISSVSSKLHSKFSGEDSEREKHMKTITRFIYPALVVLLSAIGPLTANRAPGDRLTSETVEKAPHPTMSPAGSRLAGPMPQLNMQKAAQSAKANKVTRIQHSKSYSTSAYSSSNFRIDNCRYALR
jgi:hypothetical protein